MKNLILLILLFGTTTMSSQVYIDGTVDPNVMFGIIDNPRMENDPTGVDWDLEVGAYAGRFSAFIYYGRFEEIKYQNYGMGSDFHIYSDHNFQWSVGGSVGMLSRRYLSGADWDRHVWFSWMQWNARTTGTLWWTDNIGLSVHVQYQQRGDLKIHGIIEGRVGIKYKFVK